MKIQHEMCLTEFLLLVVFKFIVYGALSVGVAIITKRLLNLDIPALRLALSYLIIRCFLTFKIELLPKSVHFE